jgi:hypothetical protein
MRWGFIAPNVDRIPSRRRRFGLIADRPYMVTIAARNGKSFTSANVVQHGGLGVAIARPMNMPIGLAKKLVLGILTFTNQL